MTNKKMFFSFLVFIATGLCYADTPPEYRVTAMVSMASQTNLSAALAAKTPSNISALCPATKDQYGTNLDEFQAKIDEIDPDRCYAAFPSVGIGRPSRCAIRGRSIIASLEKDKHPVELCFELHALQEAYSLALASAGAFSEEDRSRINAAIDAMGDCLKVAKRRSEIEQCFTGFKNSVSVILD